MCLFARRSCYVSPLHAHVVHGHNAWGRNCIGCCVLPHVLSRCLIFWMRLACRIGSVDPSKLRCSLFFCAEVSSTGLGRGSEVSSGLRIFRYLQIDKWDRQMRSLLWISALPSETDPCGFCKPAMIERTADCIWTRTRENCAGASSGLDERQWLQCLQTIQYMYNTNRMTYFWLCTPVTEWSRSSSSVLRPPSLLAPRTGWVYNLFLIGSCELSRVKRIL